MCSSYFYQYFAIFAIFLCQNFFFFVLIFFRLLTGRISLQHSLAASLRRSTAFAANMVTWRSEAQLNATTWEQRCPHLLHPGSLPP